MRKGGIGRAHPVSAPRFAAAVSGRERWLDEAGARTHTLTVATAASGRAKRWKRPARPPVFGGGMFGAFESACRRDRGKQSIALTAPPPSQKMQKIVAALALSGASALVAPAAPRATVKVQETKADLERLCAENPTALPFEGIWDPLGCADFNFWGLGNEATIGYLRHAEIKHGRIAMAGFLGFFVQSPGNFIGDIVSGDHAILPYRGYVAGCTPQEQWANIPMIGKLQILTAVGMLESYGEGAGYPASYTHYTKGGQPGYYPPIKGKGGPFKQILLDLYDPLGFGFRDMSAADKKKGLFAEINNGRMAMIGLFSVLAESAVPGSNPQYKILNIDMPTSDVDIMGSVIPQLTSPFALKAYPVLAVCALVQQQRSLKN